MSADDSSAPPRAPAAARLVVRRRLKASPERVFAAWTDPEQLQRWWGPRTATCHAAEVDLRVGRRYRIANGFPDGRTVWIVGEFEVVDAPHRLVYTWRLEPGPEHLERVTVTFELAGRATEVTVIHERIPDSLTRDGHERGWTGCLGGLAKFLQAAE